MVATVAALDVLHDAWFYWTHRLLHWRPLYRHVHYIHHRRAPSGHVAPLWCKFNLNTGHICAFDHISMQRESAMPWWIDIWRVIEGVCSILGSSLFPYLLLHVCQKKIRVLKKSLVLCLNFKLCC